MRLGIGLALTGAALLGGVVRPEILWDFTNPAAPLPGFSLTRATTGTFVAQDGSIQTAAINAPRYDWTGGVRALLMEPSATRLLGGAAITSGVSVAVTAQVYTIQFRGTGQIVLSGAHAATVVGTGVNALRTLTFTPTAGTLTVTPSGTVTNLQLEVSAAATSFVPGANGAVTRAADSLASLAMSAIWAAAGSVQGTVVADFEAGAPNNASSSYLWAVANTSQNRLSLRNNALGTLDRRVFLSSGNGAGYTDMSLATALVGRHVIAVSYQNGSAPMGSLDGGPVMSPPTSYVHNPANTALQFLFSGFNGRVRSLAVYRNAASIAQLQQMSVAA